MVCPILLAHLAIHDRSSLREMPEMWIDNLCGRMTWETGTCAKWSANRLLRACPEPSANEARMVRLIFESKGSLQGLDPANYWDSCPSRRSSICCWSLLHELYLLQQARRIASWLRTVQNDTSRHCWRYPGPPTSMECRGSLLAVDS